MNMPGFTAEVAICNGPAFFHMSAVGADHTPGVVTMAQHCPQGTSLTCSTGLFYPCNPTWRQSCSCQYPGGGSSGGDGGNHKIVPPRAP
jgi:hypothetical protein